MHGAVCVCQLKTRPGCESPHLTLGYGREASRRLVDINPPLLLLERYRSIVLGHWSQVKELDCLSSGSFRSERRFSGNHPDSK